MFSLSTLIARVQELSKLNPSTAAISYPVGGNFEGSYSFSDPDGRVVHFKPFAGEDAVRVEVEWYDETPRGIEPRAIEETLSRHTARVFFSEVRAMTAEWI
jgi:hypothetical protein